MVALAVTAGVCGPAWARESGEKEAPSGGAEASRDLNVAKKMIRAGNYSQAIPRLLKLLGDAPSSREAVEAHYHLGLAYDAIRDLRNAQLQLKQYLDRAPEGEYADDARSRVQQLTGTLDEKFVSPDKIADRIDAARQRAAQAPDEVGPQLELADLLWAKESYAEAGDVYAKILQRWPALKDDTVVRQRMYRDNSGAWRPLDPDTTLRQAADQDPLLVYNTTSFRSARTGDYSRSFQAQKYNVTGEVLNRGSAKMTDVELAVTIYGFGGKVFETKTVKVGTLAPGATRPFSVVFENFDDIENVNRFDVKGYFSR